MKIKITKWNKRSADPVEDLLKIKHTLNKKSRETVLQDFPATMTEPHSCKCGHDDFAHPDGGSCLAEECPCKAFREGYHSDPIAMRTTKWR